MPCNTRRKKPRSTATVSQGSIWLLHIFRQMWLRPSIFASLHVVQVRPVFLCHFSSPWPNNHEKNHSSWPHDFMVYCFHWFWCPVYCFQLLLERGHDVNVTSLDFRTISPQSSKKKWDVLQVPPKRLKCEKKQYDLFLHIFLKVFFHSLSKNNKKKTAHIPGDSSRDRPLIPYLEVTFSPSKRVTFSPS